MENNLQEHGRETVFMSVCVCVCGVCVCVLCVCMSVWDVCVFVGCCLATKTLNLTQSRMDGGGNGCGSELLGVTSNK